MAYQTYGRFLSRKFNLQADAITPSHKKNDGADFVPTKASYLLAQHFSAIAAAGPIVGPIVAGLCFGWLPALLWIVFGSIVIGAMHDFSSLAGSIRHGAHSVAEIIRTHMSKRAFFIFLAYVWFAMIYIIVAFTDITARAFVENIQLPNGSVVLGGGVATASVLYLVLGLLMGISLKKFRLPLWLATIIFIPLVLVVIWLGQSLPISLPSVGGSEALAWDYAILLYCGAASLIPVWALLQPRGYLGGFFLYGTLGAAFIGIMLGDFEIAYPAFISFEHERLGPLFPMLFITIACGACSGFHGIVCSGTTSKQLDKETDAHLIGYGAMLLEGVVAVISLTTVMVLVGGSLETKGDPNLIYAQGIGRFLHVFGIDPVFAVSFGLLAFTTFVYDTLDVATRLARQIFQEMTGSQGFISAVAGTLLTLSLPVFFVSSTLLDARGHIVPAWKIFWTIFGASNQLLAALTLLGLTVWLIRSKNFVTAWLTGMPMGFMLLMTLWSLFWIIHQKIVVQSNSLDPVAWAAAFLALLAFLLLWEAVKTIAQTLKEPPIDHKAAKKM